MTYTILLSAMLNSLCFKKILNIFITSIVYINKMYFYMNVFNLLYNKKK